MVVESPSARERRLARELRDLRVAGPMHGKDVAARLGWSASKVSRIETGRIGIAAGDLDRLLELYAVPEEHAAYLRRLAPAVRPRGCGSAAGARRCSTAVAPADRCGSRRSSTRRCCTAGRPDPRATHCCTASC